MNRRTIALIGVGVLCVEGVFIRSYLQAPREFVEVVGAYLLPAGSAILLLGLILLRGSSKGRFWYFLGLAVPALFLLMLAYAFLMPW